MINKSDIELYYRDNKYTRYMEQDFNNADTFVEQVKEYVNTRIAQLKLSFAEKTSKVMSGMVAVVVSALVFFLFLVLISIAGAIAIGLWLESFWLGFIVVAGIVLLAGFFLWIFKDRIIRRPIMNSLIKTMFDKEEDEKD
jgi:ABC-type uncharacterized transport system fused permease/ATPase subunit